MLLVMLSRLQGYFTMGPSRTILLTILTWKYSIACLVGYRVTLHWAHPLTTWTWKYSITCLVGYRFGMSNSYDRGRITADKT